MGPPGARGSVAGRSCSTAMWSPALCRPVPHKKSMARPYSISIGTGIKLKEENSRRPAVRQCGDLP